MKEKMKRRYQMVKAERKTTREKTKSKNLRLRIKR